MRIRVVRKLANLVDGVDLSGCQSGDLIDLGDRDARLMIAEGWAVAARRHTDASARAQLTLVVGRRTGHERRHGVDDVYERIEDKREHIAQDRRQLWRRATDHPQSISA